MIVLVGIRGPYPPVFHIISPGPFQPSSLLDLSSQICLSLEIKGSKDAHVSFPSHCSADEECNRERERFDAASVVWSRRHLTWGSCLRDGRRDLLGHRRRAWKSRSCPRHTREDDGSGGTLSKQTEHPAAALLLCCFSSLLLCCSCRFSSTLLCRDVVSGAVDR